MIGRKRPGRHRSSRRAAPPTPPLTVPRQVLCYRGLQRRGLVPPNPWASQEFNSEQQPEPVPERHGLEPQLEWLYQRQLRQHARCRVGVNYLHSLWRQQFGKCAVTGYPLVLCRPGEYLPNRVDLDLIDPWLGLAKGNLRLTAALLAESRRAVQRFKLGTGLLQVGQGQYPAQHRVQAALSAACDNWARRQRRWRLYPWIVICGPHDCYNRGEDVMRVWTYSLRPYNGTARPGWDEYHERTEEHAVATLRLQQDELVLWGRRPSRYRWDPPNPVECWRVSLACPMPDLFQQLERQIIDSYHVLAAYQLSQT